MSSGLLLEFQWKKYCATGIPVSSGITSAKMKITVHACIWMMVDHVVNIYRTWDFTLLQQGQLRENPVKITWIAKVWKFSREKCPASNVFTPWNQHSTLWNHINGDPLAACFYSQLAARYYGKISGLPAVYTMPAILFCMGICGPNKQWHHHKRYLVCSLCDIIAG